MRQREQINTHLVLMFILTCSFIFNYWPQGNGAISALERAFGQGFCLVCVILCFKYRKSKFWSQLTWPKAGRALAGMLVLVSLAAFGVEKAASGIDAADCTVCEERDYTAEQQQQRKQRRAEQQEQLRQAQLKLRQLEKKEAELRLKLGER